MANLTLLKINRFIFFNNELSPLPSPLKNNLVNTILNQIIEWLTFIPNLFTNLFNKLINQITEWLTFIPNLFTNLFNKLINQMSEWLTIIPNLFTNLINKLNQAFPPETRTHLLIIAAVCAAVLLLVLLLYFCLHLVIWVVMSCWTILTFIFICLWDTCCWVASGVSATCGALCCGCCGSAMGVMMTAPGTGGLIISRALFEGATQAYFAALHAGALVVKGVTVVMFPGA